MDDTLGLGGGVGGMCSFAHRSAAAELQDRYEVEKVTDEPEQCRSDYLATVTGAAVAAGGAGLTISARLGVLSAPAFSAELLI